jgi:hypothetical protein
MGNVKIAARKPPKRMHAQNTCVSKKERAKVEEMLLLLSIQWYRHTSIFYGTERHFYAGARVRLAGEESAGVAVAEDVPSSIAESVEAAEVVLVECQAASDSRSDHRGCASN